VSYTQQSQFNFELQLNLQSYKTTKGIEKVLKAFHHLLKNKF